jgi:hypothetical protein
MAVQPAERGVEAPPLTLSIFEFNSKVVCVCASGDGDAARRLLIRFNAFC